MKMENKNDQAPERKSEKESGSDGTADQTIYKRGAKAYGQAEEAVEDAYEKTSEAVSDAYEKTSEKVSESYEKAKSYGSENPGKSILIALGIGIGLGFILGSSTRRRPGVSGRIARPVVNALSDIALNFWR